MKNILSILKKTLAKIEDCQTNFLILLFSFTSLIIIRILLEILFPGSKIQKGYLIFYEFFDSFAIAYILSLLILNRIIKIELKKAANLLTAGFLIIVIPPLIDFALSGGNGFWSFYIFDNLEGLIRRFFTFFGNRPDFGVTYGIRLEILIVVLSLFIISLIKSKNIIKSFFVSFLIYAILFALGTFPSWIAILIKGFPASFSKVSALDSVGMFLSPFNLFSREINQIDSAAIIKTNLIYLIILSLLSVITLFVYKKDAFMNIFKKLSFSKFFCLYGALVFGILLGVSLNKTAIPFNFFNFLGFLIILESILLSDLSSTLIGNNYPNDQFFKKETCKRIGVFLLIFSAYISFLVSPLITFLLLAYQAISWIYSSWPKILKSFIFIPILVDAIACILIFFSGYILISPSQDLSKLPFITIVSIIFSFALFFLIKKIALKK